MWAVTNQTRFKAERSFARDAEGAEIWLVAVRATFTIQPDGRITVAGEQQDVRLAPKYFGEPGKASLQYDMDLVRTKPGTDVVLHTHAYSPGGRAVDVVDVAWSVGSVSKTLRVYGDRVWQHGWSEMVPGDPQPFVSMPIRYERAWGGVVPGNQFGDMANPVGVGLDTTAGKPVPNIEYPDTPTRSPRHHGPPAGFGPIPFEWQPRLKLAGTYDDVWQRERQPLVPMDFQDAYFRCAPVDQQVSGYLSGGEEVVLRNLTPGGLLRFQLPRISLGFSTRIADGTTHHRSQLHTVIIEPEEHRLIMVWHTALPCHHTLYTLKQTVVIEKERLNIGGQEQTDGELVA